LRLTFLLTSGRHWTKLTLRYRLTPFTLAAARRVDEKGDGKELTMPDHTQAAAINIYPQL